MIKDKEYWIKRFEYLEKAQIENEDKYVSTLLEEYDKAKSNIEKEISSWLSRFSINNQISLKDVNKWLNSEELKELKWDVNEYIKHGKQNGIDLIWQKELENASAKVHISRLKALKLQIQQQIEALSYKESKDTTDFIANTYETTYYTSAYELQKGHNVSFDIPRLDVNTINKIITKPWAPDEQIFSDRIWKNKVSLINTLHTDLTQAIIRGDSQDKLIEKISKDFNSSKNKAARLVMTESAFFSNASRKDCFKELGVEKYEIVATLDSHTSEICRGLDGKVYDMKDYEPGVTAPPFHVWCRSTTAPWFEDEYEFGERAARNTNGKTYYVSDDITYNDWKKRFVSGQERIEKETKNKVDNIITTMPNKVKNAIQDTKFVEKSNTSDYDRKNNIIHLMKNPSKYEILHEIGHAVETKYDVFNDNKFIEVLKDNITEMDILMAKTDDSTFEQAIDLIENDKFISKYQGRIYNFDMYGKERYNSNNKEFNYKVLGEYFSEGFATYFTNENKLLKKDKKLYDYIKELLNE